MVQGAQDELKTSTRIILEVFYPYHIFGKILLNRSAQVTPLFNSIIFDFQSEEFSVGIRVLILGITVATQFIARIPGFCYAVLVLWKSNF